MKISSVLEKLTVYWEDRATNKSTGACHSGALRREQPVVPEKIGRAQLARLSG